MKDGFAPKSIMDLMKPCEKSESDDCKECQRKAINGYRRDPQTGRLSKHVWCAGCYERLSARFMAEEMQERCR